MQDGIRILFRVPEEKGIDVRIAIENLRLCFKRSFDVALLSNQDQDFFELVDEICAISKEKERWIKVACAYPVSSSYRNRWGIKGSVWIKIDKELFDKCLDNTDYR